MTSSRVSQKPPKQSSVDALTQGLAAVVTQARASGVLTPEAVMAYAALALVDEQGLPIVPAAHHKLWLKLACDTNIKKLLIISPPESAKTTWLVAAYLTARVGMFPESNNIIASVDSSTAEKRSMTIRGMTATSTFRALFGDVAPAKGMPFEQHEWSLAPKGNPAPGRLHPTMRAYGTGQSIVGSRADLLIGDDLIDYNLSRTAHMRETTLEWFHNSFLSRRKSEGRVIIIGTMWGASDLYADMRKGTDGWVICHTPILSEQADGFYAQVTYPDGFPYPMLGEDLCH